MTSPELDWNPFARDNAIGDPGRQPEIKSVSGPLNVGVADTALDFLSLENFEIRGCSTRGWSHRYKGTPRQDSFALLTNDDVVVIAVADGVSEGDFSQVAAETAARSACKLAADQFAKNGAVDWVQLARRISMRIIEEAEYRQISQPPGDEPTIDDRLKACLTKMSTTLIVAVVQRHPQHDGFPTEIGVVAGDSAAYLLTPGDEALIPAGGGKSGSGPITSTRVRPLPGPVEPEAISLLLQPGEALLVGSDGIGDPVGDGTGDVGKEFAHRWAAPPSIDEFLLDVNVYRRSYDDDRTAVGIWIWPDIVLPAPQEPAADADADAAIESLAVADPLEPMETATTVEEIRESAPLAADYVAGSTTKPETEAPADDLVAVLNAVGPSDVLSSSTSVTPNDEATDSSPLESDFQATDFPKES